MSLKSNEQVELKEIVILKIYFLSSSISIRIIVEEESQLKVNKSNSNKFSVIFKKHQLNCDSYKLRNHCFALLKHLKVQSKTTVLFLKNFYPAHITIMGDTLTRQFCEEEFDTDDPFEIALNEFMLQELMFQHLTNAEVKIVSTVSPLWNQVVSGSKKSFSNMKLDVEFQENLSWIDVDDGLTTVRNNKRRYSEIALRSKRHGEVWDFSKPKLFDIAENLRTSLKKLEISCKNLTYDDLRTLLNPLENIEEFEILERIDGDHSEIIPLKFSKLKKLTVCGSSRASVNKFFTRVTTLESFKFRPMEIDAQVRPIGDFIMRQDNLKHLNITFSFYERDNHESLFPKNRLNEIKFQLETIEAFIRDIEFFDKQLNLKEIFLDSGYKVLLFPHDPENYGEFLRKILTKPTVELINFDYGSIRDDNFLFISDIINPTVLKVVYNETCFSVINKFSTIFPNIERIMVKDFNRGMLKYMPSSQLRFIQFIDDIEEFKYTLVDEENNPFLYEDSLLEFLRNHPKIKRLSIGRTSWVRRNFSMSLNFWKCVLHYLPNLRELIIYNPCENDNLIALLLIYNFRELKVKATRPHSEFTEKIRRIVNSFTWISDKKV